MKNQIQIYSVLLLLFFVASCKGQEKTDQPKESITPITKPETTAPQVDPYFTGSENFTSSYGPNNITRNVLQDRKGNFWFATWEGIIQYDGKTFTNFTNKKGLRRHRVFSMLEDKNGGLWFGTIGAGIYRYDGVSFTNITTKDGLVNDGIACFLEDKNGNIWIGTQNGISKYDLSADQAGGKTFTNFTTEEGLTNNDVNSIVEDKNGRFWIGTRGRACVYDGKSFTKITFGLGTPFTNVRTIMKDKKDNIWLAGQDGLWRFPPDGNQSSLTQFTKNFVGYVYEDKTGNILTSSADSSNGNSSNWVLSRYDQKSLQNKEIAPTELKAEGGMYFGIIEDRNGNIWFGTLDGVYQYNGMFFNDFKEKN